MHDAVLYGMILIMRRSAMQQDSSAEILHFHISYDHILLPSNSDSWSCKACSLLALKVPKLLTSSRSDSIYVVPLPVKCDIVCLDIDAYVRCAIVYVICKIILPRFSDFLALGYCSGCPRPSRRHQQHHPRHHQRHHSGRESPRPRQSSRNRFQHHYCNRNHAHPGFLSSFHIIPLLSSRNHRPNTSAGSRQIDYTPSGTLIHRSTRVKGGRCKHEYTRSLLSCHII